LTGNPLNSAAGAAGRSSSPESLAVRPAIPGLRNLMRRGTLRLSVWCSLATVGGCTTVTHKDWSAFLKAHEHSVTAVETRVTPGDTITIHSPQALEIDGATPEIQPDGKVSLDLVGEVQVVNLTAREIAEKLGRLLAPYYTDPKIRVQIVSQPGRVYYVLGQVGMPGPFPYTGRDTLLYSLAVAQPNPIAWASRVKVIRPSPFDDQRHDVEVNVERMIETGDVRQNVLLEPGDVVYVPPTPLGWIGLRIRELLYPVTPALRAYQSPEDFLETQDRYEDRRDRRT